MDSTTTTSTVINHGARTHSAPPDVQVDAVGQWADTAIITLDLSGGSIDRSILRDLAKALADQHGTYWLTLAAKSPTSGEQFLDRALHAARGRSVFAPELTVDAARALYEALGEALDAAETDCRRDGCPAVGIRDGLCVGHDEAAGYVPTLRSVTA
jgi:hypothetical protein